MVFEGLVSDVLSRVLGEYVKNLNKDQLKIGIFGGNVVLTNLELKEDALSNLPINLPITVKKGFLGKLELKVPWKDLKSKPVIVNIDSIYALAVPNQQSFKYDEVEEKKRQDQIKKKKLENYEWIKSIHEAEENELSGVAGGSKQQSDSFTSRLVTKIIDNLQIVVNKVHIRFENRNDLGRLYAIGVTLDKISAQSTDEWWNPSFIDSSKTHTIRKLAEMNSFGFYIDESASTLQGLPTPEFTQAFLDLIPTKNTVNESLLKKFVVKPISSQLKVTINKNEVINKSIPQILADCILSQIVMSISAPQYRTVLNILQFTNDFLRDIKYLKYRPTQSVQESPQSWWKYAGQVLMDQIKLKRYQKSWAYIQERRNNRKQYISLFKRSLPNVNWLTPLSKSEQAELADLEDRLSFEDIVFFRSLAYAEIKKESDKNKLRQKFLDSKKSERGFFTNLFSTKKVKEEDEKAAPIVQLSKEERDELYKTIEYNEVIQSVSEPPDWVKVIANLDIKGISLQLVENDKPFIDAVYSSLSVRLEQRPEGVKVEAGIKVFEVYDQFTKKTLFPKIIGSVTSKGSGTFASAIVDTRPQDKNIDLFVQLNMDPLNIIFTKPLIMKIADFFHDPELDITNISNRAGAHIVNFKERAKVQLQDAMDRHKTLSLNVNVFAPVILIPENVLSNNSNGLIIDLGKLGVKSDISSAIKGKIVSDAKEDDFYDKFNLSLESVQVLLTSDLLSWTDHKSLKKDPKAHIIDQFDILLKLYSCIQPDNLTLPKIKVSGELPTFKMNLSDKKFKQLLSIVEAVTADVSGSGGSGSGATTPTLEDGNNTTSTPSTTSNNGKIIEIHHNDSLHQSSETMELLKSHKELSLHFVIKSINVTLSNERSDLIKLLVNDLSVSFDQRYFDSIGKLELSSIEIEDCYTKNSLKKLATSNSRDLLKQSVDRNSLVLINFKQFKRNSPEFNKVDMTVDIGINTFYLVLNPSTIYQLLLVANSLSTVPQKQQPTIKTTLIKERDITPLTSPPLVVNGDPSVTEPRQINQRRRVIRTLRVQVPKKTETPKKQPTENVSIKLTAKINSLGLALNQDNNVMLGIFSINKLSTELTMYKDSRLSVQGGVGSMVLNAQNKQHNSIYNKVISCKDEESSMISFKYSTFLPTLSNYPGYEKSVSAHVKSIIVYGNIGYLLEVQNYFLGGMLDPILNPTNSNNNNNNDKGTPNTTSPQVQSPPTSSPPIGSPNLPSQQPNTPPISRTKLDIEVETPIFIVPQSETSTNGIQFELGRVLVSNEFYIHEHNELPIDKMKVVLDSTNITITSSEGTSKFLEKLNVDLSLSRYLVPNTSQDTEDLGIDINIDQFLFHMDDRQYKFFLMMADSLTGEMNKKQQELKPYRSRASVSLPSSPVADQLQQSVSISDLPYFTEDEVVSNMGRTVMKLNLRIGQLQFMIRNQQSDIAQFLINSINVDLQNTDQNKMKLQLSMTSISLSDIRENSTNIYKNLLENKQSPKHVAPFMQVGYIRNNILGDQYINVSISKPCLFLSPTPLLMIAEFFMTPLKNKQEEDQQMKKDLDIDMIESLLDSDDLSSSFSSTGSGKTSLSLGNSGSNWNNSSTDFNRSRSSSSSSQSFLSQSRGGGGSGGDISIPSDLVLSRGNRSPTITFNCNINPSVTLVEDETLETTRCLTLKTKLTVYFKRDTRQMEKANVQILGTKINIYRPGSQLSDSQQGSRPIQILKPIETITIKYIKENMTSKEWKQSIDCSITTLKLYFSYEDIHAMNRIMNNVNQAFSQSQLANHGSTKQPISAAEDEKLKKLSKHHRHQHQKKKDKENEKEKEKEKLQQKQQPQQEELYLDNESFKLSCPTISILYINESAELYLPVVELFLTDIETNAKNWSTDLELKTGMIFKADYFNENNMKFEPLIEDWTFKVDFKKNRKGHMRGLFSANQEIMNINVSHAFLQTLSSTMILMKEKESEYQLQAASPAPSPAPSPATSRRIVDTPLSKHMRSSLQLSPSEVDAGHCKFNSHWIINETGVDLEYSIPRIESSDLKLDSSRRTVPIPIKHSKDRDSTIGEHLSINLKILGGTVEKISVDAVGCTVYQIVGGTPPNSSPVASSSFLSTITSSSSPAPTQHQEIVCEVKLQCDGSKVVIIKSMDQFENNTKFDIDLKFMENGPTITLEKQARYSLPLQVSNSFKKFWIKLSNSHYWSEGIDIQLPDSKTSKLFKLLTSEKVPFFIALVSDRKEFQGSSGTRPHNTIKLHPPIQIENLLPHSFKMQLSSEPSQPHLIESGNRIDVYSYIPSSSSSLQATISDLEAIPGDTKHTLISGDIQSPSISKSFKLANKSGRELVLEIERTEDIKGIRVLSFYCQYWLVNNSMLPLQVRIGGEHLYLPPNEIGKEPNLPALYGSSAMEIRVGSPTDQKEQSKYCSPFPICTVGAATESILVTSTLTNRTFELAYTVEFCQNSKYGLSKVVTIAPKYILYNPLPYPILVAQFVESTGGKKGLSTSTSSTTTTTTNTNLSGSATQLPSLSPYENIYGDVRVEPGECKPFHWTVPISNKPKKITVQALTSDGEKWRWSGGFFIDSVNDLVIRVRNDDKPFHHSILMHVNIKDKHGTYYISFPEVNRDSSPYVIENDTPFKISFVQKDRDDIDSIQPSEILYYGWDDPSGEYLLDIMIEGQKFKKPIKFNKIYARDVVHGETKVYISVSIEGPSRVLKFSTDSETFDTIRKWVKNDLLTESQTKSEFQFYVRLSGIGLSLIDSVPRELAYVSMRDFYLQFTQSAIEHSLEIKLAEIQVDNQLVRTDFPVLFHSVNVEDNGKRKDFLHMTAIKSTVQNLDHFRYFSTLIQEINVEIEDHWLKEILDFVQSIPSFSPPVQDEKVTQLYKTITIKPPDLDSYTQKMSYFALLVLNPIKINLTLALQNDGLFKTNHKVLSSIEGLGFSLTKLDRAPISLQGLIMEHPFVSRSILLNKIKSAYLNQIIKQFYNILGSIDIIGNPVGLFRNFGTGVHDFFVEPAQGLVKSPQDFGKGLAKGTSSLVKNSVYGTFNTISKITNTIGTGVATLSFDDQYLQERKIQQAKKPKHIGEGLAMGGIGLGKGIFQGITGIVTKPVEGAKKDGFGGFAKGLVQGVVGVAIKPTTSIVDFATKTTEGIKNTTNLQVECYRVRPPRCIDKDKVLRPFNQVESEGWLLLKTVHKGKHANDNYIWHHVINEDQTVILSDQRLILIKNKKNILHTTFIYQIPYSVIKEFTFAMNQGIVLTFDPPQVLGILERDVRRTTLGVTDPTVNMIFQIKLQHTLLQYNNLHPHQKSLK
eukprot:gene6743-8360_t